MIALDHSCEHKVHFRQDFLQVYLLKHLASIGVVCENSLTQPVVIRESKVTDLVDRLLDDCVAFLLGSSQSLSNTYDPLFSLSVFVFSS